MKFGKLEFVPISERLDLVAESVKQSLSSTPLAERPRDIFVSAIDPNLADTAAFCEHYGIGMEISANCVVIEAKRADKKWYVACMILATNRLDVNSVVRRHINARKVSFAPMDVAVAQTHMEYGGITPIGLPPEWPILVDTNVATTDKVIIGSGIRSSKLLIPGNLFSSLASATVMDILL